MVIDGKNQNCGDTNIIGGKGYLTWDFVFVCLVFEYLEKKTNVISTRKVLFSPRIDKFELLEIQGLYDIFYLQGRSSSTTKSLSVRALSNGIMSRSTIFKLDGNIAEVLNLVI